MIPGVAPVDAAGSYMWPSSWLMHECGRIDSPDSGCSKSGQLVQYDYIPPLRRYMILNCFQHRVSSDLTISCKICQLVPFAKCIRPVQMFDAVRDSDDCFSHPGAACSCCVFANRACATRRGYRALESTNKMWFSNASWSSKP